MLKKIISLLVLTLYLHGMSGYTMSFHTCTITGFESVYTGFGLVDPCGDMENNCRKTAPHFEKGDCCDVQQTFVNIDDGCKDVPWYVSTAITNTLIQSYLLHNTNTTHHFYNDSFSLRPPEPCDICVFRI